jgi:hypothetical protein
MCLKANYCEASVAQYSTVALRVADVALNYTHCNKNLKLRWAGNLEYMEEKYMTKRSLYSKISGKRKVGRQKSKWLHEVNVDAKRLWIRKWWSRS